MGFTDRTNDPELIICLSQNQESNIVVNLTDDQGPLDISTWVLEIVVTTELHRTEADDGLIFTSTGSFITDGKDGGVSFPIPTGSLSDIPPGTAYYFINRLSPDADAVLKARVKILAN